MDRTKGQIISECLFDFLNFPKKNTKKFDKFLPKDLKTIREMSLTGYDGDIPALIPEKYFLMVNFDAL